jgi:hypothetical protein
MSLFSTVVSLLQNLRTLAKFRAVATLLLLGGIVSPFNEVSAACPGTFTISTVSGLGCAPQTFTLTINQTAAAVGTVVKWQRSNDNFASNVVDIASTDTFLLVTAATDTVWYRVISNNAGACTSDVFKADIFEATNAGTISGTSTGCVTANSGTLTVAAYTGGIQWLISSTNLAGSFASAGNTSATLTFTNLAATRYYKVVSSNGPCANDTTPVAFTVTISPASVAGTISGGATVCSGTNSGTLTLAGNTGTVTKWQSSINGGTSYSDIVNTTTSQAYTNLTQTTQYRAIVQSGACAADTAAPVIITVSPVSVAGTISGAATVCSGSNSGTLTLSGNTGTVTKWQSSINGGTSYSDIVNTTTSQAYTNLTQTTQYRAIVQSGACAADTTAPVIITVSPVSVAGTISGAATVCSGSNSGTLTLAGSTGTIVWESAAAVGGPYTATGATGTTQSYTNLSATTFYRAVVTSGACASATATPVSITVTPTPVGGNISVSTGSVPVCTGTGVTLQVTGSTGTRQWQVATAIGGPYANGSLGTALTQATGNLTSARFYRVQLSGAGCSTVFSDTFTVNVSPTSVAGNATAVSATTLCENLNIVVTNDGSPVGTLTKWQVNINGGGFTDVAGSAGQTTLTYPPSSGAGSYVFRAVRQSGGCAAVNTGNRTFTVNALSDVGSIAPTSATVCGSTNSTTLTRTPGTAGNGMRWERSTTSPTTGFSAIGGTNNNNSITLTNITTTTYIRAYFSATCNDTFPVITITHTAGSDGGTAAGSSTSFCATGASAGTITLTGQTGTILKWIYSPTGLAGSWTDTAVTTASIGYPILTATRYYAAVVQQGTCPIDTSIPAVITISGNPVGGTVSISSGSSPVCSGSGVTLQVTGSTGNRQWQSSTSPTGPFSNGSLGTAATQATGALSATTYYRVVLSGSGCPTVFSDTFAVVVNPTSVAGTITQTLGNATECTSGNSGTLTLSGNTGTIVWQSASAVGGPYAATGSTASTQTYTNLTSTTFYRAVVTSGVCPSANSTPFQITVNTATVGGTISVNSGSVPVCSGSGITLQVTGSTGTRQWQSSTSPTGPFANGSLGTAITQATGSLTSTRYYRVELTTAGCATSYSDTFAVVVDPNSIAGTITQTVGNATECAGSNSGTLTLAGNTGTIVWQSASVIGGPYTATGSTGSTQTYTNLTSTTFYRAVVTSGVCASATSSVTTITVNPVSVSGTISLTTGTTPKCTPSSGTLTLTGSTGSIVWESSLFPTGPFAPSGSTSATQTFTGLTDTIYYRAVVTSGVCPSATSSVFTVQVDPTSVAGTISAVAPACASSIGTLTLTGFTGLIDKWEISTTSAAGPYTDITNTTNTQNYNLTDTAYYRAVVTSGVCASATTAPRQIIVDAVTVPGTISQTVGNDTVCFNVNAFTLRLNGYVGNQLQWQVSTDNGLTFNDIGGQTGAALSRTNITQTSLYRVEVQNGTCLQEYSDTFQIVVNATTNAGTITPNEDVCSGESGTITLTSNNGVILEWQSSPDNTTWTPIANTTNSQAYSNVTSTIFYRALVQNSPCVAAFSASSRLRVVTPAVPTGASTLTDLCTGNDTVVVVANPGSAFGYGVRIDWYDAPTGGNLLQTGGTSYNTPVLNADANYYAEAVLTTAPFCASLTRKAIVVPTDQSPSPSVSSAKTAYEPLEAATFQNSGTLAVNSYEWTVTGSFVGADTTYSIIGGSNAASLTLLFLGSATGLYTIKVKQTSPRPFGSTNTNTLGCATLSAAYVVNVNPCPIILDTIRVSFSGNRTAICKGSTAVVSIGNDAKFSTIQWQQASSNSPALFNTSTVPGSGNSRTFITSALTTDVWYRAKIFGSNAATCVDSTVPKLVKVVDAPYIRNITPTSSPSTPSTVCANTPAIIVLDTTQGNITWQISGNFATGTGGPPWYNIFLLPANRSDSLTFEGGVPGSYVGGGTVVTTPQGKSTLTTPNLPYGRWGAYYYRARVRTECDTITTAQVKITVNKAPNGTFQQPASPICVTDRLPLRATGRTLGNGSWKCNNCLGTLGVVSQDSANYVPTGSDAGQVLQFVYTVSQEGCPPLIDTNFVSVDSVPLGSFNATPATICLNGPDGVSAPLGATLTKGTGQWLLTNGGTGTFTPSATDPNAQYNANANDINIAGGVELTWRVSNGVCASVDYRQRITVNPRANGTFPQPTSPVCVTSNVILQSSGRTIGTGVWSCSNCANSIAVTDQDNATYFPAPSDAGNTLNFRYVVSQPGCTPNVDETRQVVINAIPVGSFSTFLPPLCFDSTSVNLNATATTGSGQWLLTNGGTGTFSPNATSPNARYVANTNDVNIAGGVELTWRVSNGVCTPVDYAQKITVNPQPNGTLLQPVTPHCVNENISLKAVGRTIGVSRFSTSGAGFLSTSVANPDSATYVPSPTDAGTSVLFTYTVSIPGCTDRVQSFPVFLTPDPRGTFVTPLPRLCLDDTTPSLAALASIGTGKWHSILGKGTFLPSRTDQNARYKASPDDTLPSGGVDLIWRVGNGVCDSVDYVSFLTVVPQPYGDFSYTLVPTTQSVEICVGQPITLSSLIALNKGTGSWSVAGGAGTFVPNNTSLNAVYVPVLSDGEKTLSFAWTVSNGTCVPQQTNRAISIKSPSTGAFNTIPDTICVNSPTGPLGASASIGTGVWSCTNCAGGLAAFDDTLDGNTVFHGRPGDEGQTVTLYWIVTNGVCKPDTNIQTVFVRNIIVDGTFAPINNDSLYTLCEDSTSVQLGATTQTGEGEWTILSGGGIISDVNNPNATYTAFTGGPDSVKLQWRVFDPLCGGYEVKFVRGFKIRRNPKGAFVVPPDPICQVDTTNPLGAQLFGSDPNNKGKWTAEPAGGSFIPNDSTPNARFVPDASQAGLTNLRLRWTINANSCKTISFTQPLTVYRSSGGTFSLPPASICTNEASLPLAATQNFSLGTTFGIGTWSSNGNGGFTSTTDPNARYIPLATDAGDSVTITWTVINGSCDPISYQQKLYVIPPSAGRFVSIDSGFVDRQICIGSPSNPLNGQITDGKGKWSTTPPLRGFFTPNDSDRFATFTPYPNATADTNSRSLAFNTITLNWTVKSDKCEEVNYPQSIVVFTPSAVEVDTSILVQLDSTICLGEATKPLGMTAVFGAGKWTSDGAGTFTNDASGSASYISAPADSNKIITMTFTVTNGPCSSVALTRKILVRKLDLTIGTQTQQNIPSVEVCRNSSLQLIAVSNDTATYRTKFKWTGANTNLLTNDSIYNPIFIVGDVPNGTNYSFTCTATDSTGCSISKNIVIQVNDQGKIVISGTNGTVVQQNGVNYFTSICQYKTINLKATSIPNGTTLNSFVWSADRPIIFSGSTNSDSLTATLIDSTTTIYLNAVTGTGCPVVDSIQSIVFLPAKLSIVSLDICEKLNQTISVVNDPPNVVQRYWFYGTLDSVLNYNGASRQNLDPAMDVMNPHYILRRAMQLTPTFNADSTVLRIEDTLLVRGLLRPDTIPLMNIIDRSIDTTRKIHNFVYVVRTSNGCFSPQEFTYKVVKNPKAEFIATSTVPESVIESDSTFIRVEYLNREFVFTNQSDTSIVGGQLEYLWNFGDLNSGDENNTIEKDPTHRFSSSGSFTVTLSVSNSLRCGDIRTRTQYIIVDDPKYFFPTAFSPNNDVRNDTFRVLPLDGSAVINEFEVYNTNGRRIFNLGNKPDGSPYLVSDRVGWDGRDDSGTPMDNGVYTFKVVLSQTDTTRPTTDPKAVFLNGKTYTGIINLIR